MLKSFVFCPGRSGLSGAERHTPWVISIGALATCLILSGGTGSAETANAGITVLASSETAPAGGTAQIKFSLARPHAILSGQLAVDFDPNVFGPIAAVTVISAAGDGYGLAVVDGRHAVVRFGSPSGGIGRVANVPILAVTVPVLAGAVPGSKATISADLSGSVWNDAQGNVSPITVSAGTVTIGGQLSVRGVVPGGGVLPAGSVVRIDGTGFTPATTIEVEGVVVASVEFVGPKQINLTLGGQTEIAGKRVRVTNPDGSELDYYPSLAGVAVTGSGAPATGSQLLMPLAASEAGISTRVFWALAPGGIAVRNPNPGPVDVVVQATDEAAVIQFEKVLTLPPGGSIYQDGTGFFHAWLKAFATAPVQMLEFDGSCFDCGPYSTPLGAQPLRAMTVPPLQLYVVGDSPVWNWRIGSAAPQAQTFLVVGEQLARRTVDFNVSAVTESGGKWLRVTPSAGTICAVHDPSCAAGSMTVTVMVDPASLPPGRYRGSITITPVGSIVTTAVQPSVVSATLVVTAAPFVSSVLATTNFTLDSDGVSPPSVSYSIPHDLFPGAFPITTLTDGGGNWLSASPSGGLGPRTVMISANPSGLGPGRYSGEVIISGYSNVQVMPVLLTVPGGILLRADSPIRISVGPGEPPPPPQIVSIVAECVSASTAPCPTMSGPGASGFTTTVRTNSGGNWLKAAAVGGAVSVSVDPTGLRAGMYTGSITLGSGVAAGPTQVPVTLTIQGGPISALTADPPALFFPQYGISTPYVSVGSTTQQQLQYSLTVSTSDGGSWLSVSNSNPQVTPASFKVIAEGSGLAPGVYAGSVVLTALGQSLAVPVTLTVSTPSPPLLGSIVSAASGNEGAVSPGEIITLHGVGVGPDPPAGFMIGSEGKVATNLSGTRVLFDGAPAPVVFASASQINAIVPYEAAAKTSAAVEVEYRGQRARWGVPVAPATPAIFTLDATGRGWAAALNSDSYVNTPSRPAARGTAIAIFATGVSVPGAVTGSISPRNPPSGLPVTVIIGGIEALVVYAGPAPEEVAGLIQVNAVVPQGVSPGPAVPVVLVVGPSRSQDGVTIAIQ